MSASDHAVVSLRIETIKASEGCWEFFDGSGDLVSRHITAGHMAQQYRDLFNEMMRLRDVLGTIANDVSERRERAAKEDGVCPYAETETERFCYFRGMREGLSGINSRAYDAILGRHSSG